MQSYSLINKIQLTILSILICGVSLAADPIGDIREVTGNTSIVRDKEILETSQNLEIELYDEAQTGNGRMLIEFLDEAELALKEHSQVLIDEVYYDPDPSLSKMSMKMVMGTARFASGSLGLVNKANIDISTPTATIAIRGTDFTTTIDELGRSLIVLLPDQYGNPSGEIVVSNNGGEVTLNQAYAATLVSSLDNPPMQQVVINGITPSIIDNMFIVNPPTEIKNKLEEELQDDQNKDQGILDVDFLQFDELEEDELAEDELDEFTELDIDELDVDFLVNVLDQIDSRDLFGSLGEFDLKGARAGLNKESQYNVFLRDGNLVLYRNVNGVIEVQIGAGGNFTLDTITNTFDGTITGNDGQDIEIVIRQLN
jgi:hypothetical protein